MKNVAVIGAGSWGTALGLVAHGQGCRVKLWGHDPGHIEEIHRHRENRMYLSGVALPEEMYFTSELGELSAPDVCLLVVPSKAIREVTCRMLAAGILTDTCPVLCCTKGVERGSGLRMSEIVREHFPLNPVAALSGPSHAEEVARALPTAVVLGASNPEVGTELRAMLSTRSFRVYRSDDMTGIELGGALKNIFAIAAGVVDGLGLGDNAKAALVTRSVTELTRLGVALGGVRETFMGLSGVGDLMVTCYSRHSRNRGVGERLGKGESIGCITASMQMVAEGVPTTYSGWECARRFNVRAPIIEQVRNLLDGTVSPLEAMDRLMSREAGSE